MGVKNDIKKTWSEAISKSMSNSYPEYEIFLQEKSGKKRLYLLLNKKTGSDNTSWVAFGYNCPGRFDHGFSHQCIVNLSGFNVVKRPKGTKPCR